MEKYRSQVGENCRSLQPMLTRAQIHRLRFLRDKKGREELGLYVVEGEKVVGELIAAGCSFEDVYATEAWAGRRTVQVSDREMARISHFSTPSAVLAIGRIARRTLAPEELNRGLTLALDHVQDPGNVGTLLRIADWFALDRVVLSPNCADLFSQKVINASMGSFARLSVYTADLSAALSSATVPVIGCDLKGEDVHLVAPRPDAVIVVGSEGQGLSGAVKRWVTQTVTIPRYGQAESLNAAVAAAIVCDNLRRPR